MFKLHKLEITGFKSFADYTEIIFTGEGITAIVGPNGCGKSNVSDSITWVLGEQRARNLRGGEMQDVIFQGAQNRPPSGMAEVVLHLQRTDDPVPPSDIEDIDAALAQIDESPDTAGNNALTPETLDSTSGGGSAGHRHWRPARQGLAIAPGEIVTVTRRLYRSGESEYLLNGRACRLRDIQDMFAGTGLSGTHYAIVEQGRIGQILSAKPMDRRVLIEEAAGVSKFRVRQRAAESRLQTARANLHRLSDIVGEIDRQVNSLRRQAAKARRYRLAREELREVLRRLFLAEARELTTLLEDLQIRWHAASQHESALAETLAARAAEARAATQTARDSETELAALRAAAAEAALQRERRARDKDYQTQQIAQLVHRRAEIAGENEALAASRQQVLAEIVRVRADDELLRAGQNMAAARLQEAETAYQHRRRLVAQAEQELENARAALLQRSTIAERLAGVMRQLEHTGERLAQQALGLQREGERAAAVHAEHIAQQDALREELRSARTDLDELRARQETAQQIVGAAREAVRATGAEYAQALEAASRVRHRLDSLLEVQRKHAHYTPVVQQLLAEATRHKHFAAQGTLAEMLRVQPEWEHAVEAVLGPALQTILVPTARDAAQAAGWLAQQKAGRAGFLVLSDGNGPAVPELATGETNAKAAHNGTHATTLILEAAPVPGPRLADVLGVAPDLLTVLQDAWPHLLQARLVNDLAEASEISAATGALCVTRAGACVAGPWLQAGEARGVSESAGLLAFNRELRELQESSDILENAVIAAAAIAQDARAKLPTAEADLQQNQALVVRAEREIMAQDLKAKQLAQELERAARHQRVVAGDTLRLAQEQEDVQRSRVQAQDDAARAEQARSQAQDQMSAAQDALQQTRHDAENESQALSVLRAAAAAAAERHRAALQELRRREHEEQELAMRLGRQARELQESARQLQQLNLSVTELAAQVARAEAEQAAEAVAIDDGTASLQAARRHADALAAELSELNQQAAAVRDERAALEVRRAATGERLNHVRENSVTELHQTPEELAQERPEADDAFDLVAGRAKVEELRAKIEGFGAVNMMALEELAEAEERFTFLTTQRQDIVDGISATEEALKEIKKRSRERFRQAFFAINRHFGVIFQELFGGGRGEMSLLDESDVLESGIELVAQPPGKRLQNVLLLSGGEKAMAALALVLAIFRYRPSPFCLLDEVDAPLDEANVGRFVEKVRQMSEETQFLVITHNKRTMEAARALYGVTMQAAGVSKLVSVKFE